MAGVVVARAFWDRMRFKLAAANQLIDKEGLDSIDELRDLDSKRCERIVAKLIKPGGVDDDGDPNRGVEVSDRAQTNFGIAVHRAVMWDRTQRPYVLANIDIDDDFEMAKHQLKQEESHVNPILLIKPYEDKQLKDSDFFTAMRLCKSCRRSCQNPSKSLQNSVQNLRNPIFPQNLRQNSHLCKTCSQSCAGSEFLRKIRRPGTDPAAKLATHKTCGETCDSCVAPLQLFRRNLRCPC